jgi:excisionase family DNA binding protein
MGSLTLTEAAQRLGLVESTLRRQARLGRLRASKVDGRWCVDVDEVERYRRVSRGLPGRRSRGQDDIRAGR